MSSTNTNISKVSFLYRCMALSYDLILLICLYICATFLIVMLNKASIPAGNIYYRLFLLFITYLFFTFFWYKYNQTTGMLAWKIKLVSITGGKPSFTQVSLRFILAIFTNLIFGIGILWALFDRNNLALYDHLSKTKLIKISK